MIANVTKKIIAAGSGVNGGNPSETVYPVKSRYCWAVLDSSTPVALSSDNR